MGTEFRKGLARDLCLGVRQIADGNALSSLCLFESCMLEAKTYTGIDNLPEQYSRLFEEAGQDSVFLSLPWFRNLERTVLGVNEVVQVVGVEKRASSSVALGALVLKVNRRSNRFLSPLTIDSLTNYYTSYFAPVLARHWKDLDVVLGMLARELYSRRPHWDVLNIRPVDLSLPGVQRLHGALTELGVKNPDLFLFWQLVSQCGWSLLP